MLINLLRALRLLPALSLFAGCRGRDVRCGKGGGAAVIAGSLIEFNEVRTKIWILLQAFNCSGGGRREFTKGCINFAVNSAEAATHYGAFAAGDISPGILV
jgi:hypothetical protein